MTIKNALSASLNRFRTVSKNHPIGVVWNNNVMTFHQLSSKFNISLLFEYCYMPKGGRHKGVILPKTIDLFLEAQHYLENSEESVFVVPRVWGFDILKPNKTGDPLIVYEIRFRSIDNPIVMWFLRWIPEFSTLMKNIK